MEVSGWVGEEGRLNSLCCRMRMLLLLCFFHVVANNSIIILSGSDTRSYSTH